MLGNGTVEKVFCTWNQLIDFKGKMKNTLHKSWSIVDKIIGVWVMNFRFIKVKFECVFIEKIKFWMYNCECWLKMKWKTGRSGDSFLRSACPASSFWSTLREREREHHRTVKGCRHTHRRWVWRRWWLRLGWPSRLESRKVKKAAKKKVEKRKSRRRKKKKMKVATAWKWCADRRRCARRTCNQLKGWKRRRKRRSAGGRNDHFIKTSQVKGRLHLFGQSVGRQWDGI